MLDHTELKIWQRSMALSLRLDHALLNREFSAPPGLVSQLSRSCASIPSNIAEGAGQASAAQAARFLDIAIGSMSETQNHLTRADGLQLLEHEVAASFIAELSEIRRKTFSYKKWTLRQFQHK